MRNEEIEHVIKFLNASWQGAPLKPETAAVWGAEFSAMQHDEVIDALHRLRRTSKFRPSLAEILNEIEPMPAASESFAHVWDQISKRPPSVNAMEAEAVRRMGGWDVLRHWQIQDRHFHAKRYAQVYGEVLTEHRQRRYEGKALQGEVNAEPVAAVESATRHDDVLTGDRLAELASDVLGRFK